MDAQLRNILYKIYSALDNGDVTVVIRRCEEGCWGEYYDDCSIHLNPQSPFYPTLIHEVLHHLYPDYPEEQVESLETEICQSMSITQWKNLVKKVSKCLAENA